MTACEFEAAYLFEDSLAVGSPVLVRWTNCGDRRHAAGTIARVNACSFRVTLAGAPERQVLVPRIESIRQWSACNRVEPVGGYVVEGD